MEAPALDKQRDKRIVEGKRILKELGLGQWTEEERDLGAGIQGMIAAIHLFRKQGYDPVELCKLLANDKKVEKIIGRRLGGG